MLKAIGQFLLILPFIGSILFILVFLFIADWNMPTQPWQWLFITGIFASFCIQELINRYFSGGSGLYASVKTQGLLRAALDCFTYLAMLLVLTSVFTTTKEGVVPNTQISFFFVHMTATLGYLSLFVFLDIGVIRSLPANQNNASIVKKAKQFRETCARFLFWIDGPAFLSLLALWVVLESSVEPRDFTYAGAGELHDIVHVIMSGAVGLHMFLSAFLYLSYRMNLTERA